MSLFRDTVSKERKLDGWNSEITECETSYLKVSAECIAKTKEEIPSAYRKKPKITISSGCGSNFTLIDEVVYTGLRGNY